MRPSPAEKPMTRQRRASPWSPAGVAIATVLVHPLFGGVLHALNWRPLGRLQRRKLDLWRNLLVGAILVLLTLVAPEARGLRSAITFFVAIDFYKSQAAPFADHLASGGRRRSLLAPIALLVLCLLVLVGIVAGVEYYFATAG